MASIQQHVFAGIQPAIDDKHLDPRNAVTAHNTMLRDHTLRPFRAPLKVENTASTRGLYLVRDTGTCKGELRIDDVCSFVLDLPGLGPCHGFDQVVIFYKNCQKQPQRFFPCSGEYAPLVVPRPQAVLNIIRTVAGTIETNIDGAGPDARSYTYTWVDKFGIESPPAPPTVTVQSFDDETWALSGFGVPPANAAFVRVYRTTSPFSDGNKVNPEADTSYQMVSEVPLPLVGNIFIDNKRLINLDYFTLMTIDDEPPPKLTKVMSMQSGYAVGYSGSSIYFSERHEPHNWPSKYKVTLKHRITGLAVFEDTIFVGTTGKPYRIFTKTNVAQSAIPVAELMSEVHEYIEDYPCMSGGSMVGTNFGALYTTRDGMVALQPRGAAQLITRPLVDQDMWLRFMPNLGCWHNGKYFGIRAPTGKGFILDVKEGAEGKTDFGEFVTIDMDATVIHAGHDGLLYFAGKTGVYIWHKGTGDLTYTYKSKVFRQSDRSIVTAAKVVADYGTAITFTLYADGVKRYQTQVTSSAPFNLPRVGRALDYQYELRGTTRVREVHLGTTRWSLASEGKGGQQ
jgi:hypothetical protein